MEALRLFAYGTSLGPFPVVVWFGFTTLLFLLLTVGIAVLRKRVPALRRVFLRVHRAAAITTLVLALCHLTLGLSVYV
jgi:hypothetical protein